LHRSLRTISCGYYDMNGIPHDSLSWVHVDFPHIDSSCRHSKHLKLSNRQLLLLLLLLSNLVLHVLLIVDSLRLQIEAMLLFCSSFAFADDHWSQLGRIALSSFSAKRKNGIAYSSPFSSSRMTPSQGNVFGFPCKVSTHFSKSFFSGT
jgi:hypothetical protein